MEVGYARSRKITVSGRGIHSAVRNKVNRFQIEYGSSDPTLLEVNLVDSAGRQVSVEITDLRSGGHIESKELQSEESILKEKHADEQGELGSIPQPDSMDMEITEGEIQPTLIVAYIPQSIGNHIAYIKYDGIDIVGSPFAILIQSITVEHTGSLSQLRMQN